jgi:hypothetical protein
VTLEDAVLLVGQLAGEKLLQGVTVRVPDLHLPPSSASETRPERLRTGLEYAATASG